MIYPKRVFCKIWWNLVEDEYLSEGEHIWYGKDVSVPVNSIDENHLDSNEYLITYTALQEAIWNEQMSEVINGLP